MVSNILVIGGSRHIGYHAALRFLDTGARVNFLLRSPAVFDDDMDIQRHVRAGRAVLIKGDGLVIQDVRNVWMKASELAPVDLILFTVGFTGNNGFLLTKGVTMDPPNLVTQCLLNALCEMPKPVGVPLPKIIVLSTTGVSRTSRHLVPLIHRPLYGYMISQPVKDKLGMERVIFHCAGWKWNPEDGEPKVDIMGEGWKERYGLPEPGSLTGALIVRASILNDGECKADMGGDTLPYRVVEGADGGYSISRKDVAHFVFKAVTKDWEKYGNKQVSVSY